MVLPWDFCIDELTMLQLALSAASSRERGCLSGTFSVVHPRAEKLFLGAA